MQNDTVDELLDKLQSDGKKVTLGQTVRLIGRLQWGVVIAVVAGVIAVFYLGVRCERWLNGSNNSLPGLSAPKDDRKVEAIMPASKSNASAPSLESDDAPSELPRLSIITDMPSEDAIAKTRPLVLPTSARLLYKNESDIELKLFLFDCSTYYAGVEGYWHGFPMPRGADFKLWDRFPQRSTGWFGFVARNLETGKDVSLGCHQLFQQQDSHIRVTGSKANLAIHVE